MPSPAAKPTSWRIGMAASAASRSRLRWSCCRAPRPMVRPSVAAVGWTGALIWDANLGFGAGAAQEFRFVDERDAERLGLVALRAGIGAHDQRRRSEEHTSELQSHVNLVCRLLLEKKKQRVTWQLFCRLVAANL